MYLIYEAKTLQYKMFMQIADGQIENVLKLTNLRMNNPAKNIHRLAVIHLYFEHSFF